MKLDKVWGAGTERSALTGAQCDQRLRELFALLLVSLLAASACGGGSTPVVACTAVAEAAKVGCRSSDEPGCQTCCVPSATGCDVRAQPCNGGYCSNSSMAQCPQGCAPCAPCSKASEEGLCRALPIVMSCDCDHIDVGIDPCFAPDSCNCKCAGYKAARAACPP